MSGYTSDLTVRVKLLPRNSMGVLPIASAVEMSLTTASRYLKPYPPGNVKLNNLAYASWPSVSALVPNYRGDSGSQAISSLSTIANWFLRVGAGRVGSATALSVTVARIKLEYLPIY